MSPADGASHGSRENIMGDQPIQFTVCPSCGADLLAEQSRDPLTLKDVDVEVEVQNGSLIQQADVRYKQLLAWRCLTCSAVVPAYEPTSPIRELAERLFNEPERDAPSDNPFTNPAGNYEGDSDQQLSSMTSDELRENERYWDWEMSNTSNPYNHWWCSKAHSRATRELDRRGLDHDSR